MKTWLGALLMTCAVVAVAHAKRTPAPVVPPITHGGVVYHARGDGETAFIVANDEKTGNQLWKAKVYHVQIDPLKEADVQMMFIRGMLLFGEKLLIQDQAGRCYQLELETHKVQGTSCKKYRSVKSATP